MHAPTKYISTYSSHERDGMFLHLCFDFAGGPVSILSTYLT